MKSLRRVRHSAMVVWMTVACLGGKAAILAQEPELPPAPSVERLFPTDETATAIVPLVSAADESPQADSAESELAALRRRLEQLEAAEKKRREGDEKKKADDARKKEEDKQKAEGWTDLSTDKWTVKLGGHVQMDLINWADASPSIPDDRNYFEFRRLRLVADGTGYGVYDFRVQFTLEPETVGESAPGQVTSPEIKDAYFSINEIPWLGRLRIGNFFVPFSLEQVTNDTNNVFLERSIPTQGVFAADREVGVAMYNATEDLRMTWTTGIFLEGISDALKERIDDNQGYRLAGRFTWLPYYDEPSNGRYLVHTGLGILHTDDQDDRVRFRARPQIREGPRIIDSGVLAADAYTTGNVEAAVVWGPVTVQSEAFLCSVNMVGQDNEWLSGAYAHISYFLTGENRIYERFGQHGAQFARNVPYTNVFATPGGCGWGGWELKARWSYLNLNSVNRGEYNDLTAGMNWYWSDRVRIMFDWIHPVTTTQAVFGDTKSDILAMRFDFNW